MKRGLYTHECTERFGLGQESLVVIGSHDELLHDPISVKDWVEKHWPDTLVRLIDFNHGAIMGHPDPYARLLWDFLRDDCLDTKKSPCRKDGQSWTENDGEMVA